VAIAGDTRDRILRTAWGLVLERGAHAVTVADVARASGVSRQLVYLHFGHRAGLLTAMARHHDKRSGFVARVRATERLPPVEALEALLRAWLAYVPEILPVARALEAAEAAGDEGGEAWRDRMRGLRQEFRAAVTRVEQAGRLAPGWSAGEATDWAWARSHMLAWQHLVVDCGWPAERFVERTVRSIMAELVTG
jgi:AcrR family transcriptional regulator